MLRYSSGHFFTRFNRSELTNMEKGQGDPGSYPEDLFYERALFLNYIVKNWSFDKTKLSKYELKDYELAVEKL